MTGLHYGHDNMGIIQRGIKRCFDVIVSILPLLFSVILWPIFKTQAKMWFKVLKGELSIVGPELLTLSQQEELATQTYDYLWLNDVKPGIVSESRIYFPHDDQHLMERMQADLRYISTRTLLRDMMILCDLLLVKFGLKK